MAVPDQSPTTPEEVKLWCITDPYDQYLQNRLAVIQRLFDDDPMSIDAIALATVWLSSLAELRYANEPANDFRKDQSRFHKLLTEHCPSFKNRVSIPEMLFHSRKDPQFAKFEDPILRRFPIVGSFQVRRTEEDPTVAEFNEWADLQAPRIPDAMRLYDYASCIFRHYRNSVLHQASVAKGREARGSYGQGPGVFYEHNSSLSSKNDPITYIRFGIIPRFLLHLLQDVVSSLRFWAIANDRNIFGTA